MGGPREVYDAHVQLQFEADDIENAPTLKACLYLVRFPVSLTFILLRESASFPFTFNSGQPLSRPIGANWNFWIWIFGDGAGEGAEEGDGAGIVDSRILMTS